MLKLTHIKKSYTVSDFTQVALDDASIAFRDNEFVAILGPSGSGKTTMLNIIGGLDHYDSGDLIIDGVSTKEYKDRDWDTYRNNRIGFVFQSYNLIPHQTVLANVELALTLSGIARTERRERALEALEKVGLKEHINKKPTQLSGGQMQRVAIARALINNPEILLADEPTGALDSKTSVQIMDLLTEIAKDRLVIMVTHNPELAEQYATRIVNLSDGIITADTNPFNPEEQTFARQAKKIRRTSMSFLTALSLSFNNLMTKKGRTIMTAFAGSIGIIGIAAILALANGTNNYIASVEEDALSEYPLTIQDTSFDITALLGDTSDDSSSPMNRSSKRSSQDGSTKESIGVMPILNDLLSSVGTNDMVALKSFLDSERSLDPHVNAIEYSYNVSPQIYSPDTTNGPHQVNPDKTFKSIGLGGTSSNSLLSSMMSTDIFFEMPENQDLCKNQYSLLAGKWPENYDELLLVLTADGKISDFMAYAFDFRDIKELKDAVTAFDNNETAMLPSNVDEEYALNRFIGKSFKLVQSYDYYQFDAGLNAWIDKTDNQEFLTSLINNGESLHICGIVMPEEGKNSLMLKTGINYTPALTKHIAEKAAESEIVKQQLADEKTNVFTGKSFAEDAFDPASLFSIDFNGLKSAFSMDDISLSLDPNDFKIDPNNLKIDLSKLKLPDINGITSLIQTRLLEADVPLDPLVDGSGQALTNYLVYCASQGVPPSGDGFEDFIQTDPATILVIGSAIQEYVDQYDAPFAAAIAEANATYGTVLDPNDLGGSIENSLKLSMAASMTEIMADLTTQLEAEITKSMTNVFSQFESKLSGLFDFDEEKLASLFKSSFSEESIASMLQSGLNLEQASAKKNLKTLGYVNDDNPSEIRIYPKSFEDKEKVKEILDAYNSDMENKGEKEKIVSYNDIVGTLMKSVTEIVNMISTVLIAFVAISLIVSSIMIGVITYISVLERRKEIGILRSIGASKGDIARVFNAETVIEGLIAGIIGIVITLLGSIPANAIVYSIYNVPNVVSLPVSAALLLIGLSVLLTFIAGLFPAMSASRKDPVEALRSE